MDENLKYEDAIKKLEKIVLKLEKGNTTLDETVKLYDEATKLSGYCEALLNNAKLKIKQMSSEGEIADD